MTYPVWPTKTRELHNHPFDSTVWNAIVEHCSFEWTKANATKSVPLGGAGA